MTERLGIFGGTFDPPHVAHLAVAAQALTQLGLDRVLIVVAGDPWQKHDGRRISPAGLRLAMVAAAIRGHDHLEASAIEIDRGGESYTIDTVRELARPDRELFLIIGSELVAQLPTWKECDALPGLVTLAISRRPGSPLLEPPPVWNWVPLRLPALDLSSTELREMVARGLPVDFLVPDPALSVMLSHRLYAESGTDTSKTHPS